MGESGHSQVWWGVYVGCRVAVLGGWLLALEYPLQGLWAAWAGSHSL